MKERCTLSFHCQLKLAPIDVLNNCCSKEQYREFCFESMKEGFFPFLRCLSFCLKGIMPNKETKVLLFQIFGDKSHPVRKYQRLMYWFPKFKHVNPYPVPEPLPQDPIDLARLSLQRITADMDAKVIVYQVN